ncbi:hypothetical protein B566_EDAN004728 [Ephemera danica]|nr:hypothetical protein B566_EDAN004728 [Ephemera danica]
MEPTAKTLLDHIVSKNKKCDSKQADFADVTTEKNASSEQSSTFSKEECDYFNQFYNKWKVMEEKCPSYGNIPQFYYKLPKDDAVLTQKLREESRAMFLQRRSRQLLDNNELKALWVLLDKNHTPPLSGEEQMINYKDFLKVSNLAGPKCRAYFRPSVFAKLQSKEPFGRVSIMALFNYVMRKVWLQQTRIGLSLYDLRDEELPKDLQEANWFSAPSALRVYGTGTLTSVFLERVFQECLTYDGEMDYKTYLDFVLALENRAEPQALHYIFRILDVKGQGYLDVFSLNYFFRGDTMVSILTDLNGFWTYENREAMAAETTDPEPAEV